MSQTIRQQSKFSDAYFSQMQCRIDPAKIGVLRFLLEGYDEMALVSTINSQEGIIRLRCAVCFEPQLFTVLQSLGVSQHQILFNTGA